MSWAFKILLLYLGFVTIILTLVFTCFKHKTELEFTDYYARELRFQDQLNARSNADALVQPISYQLVGSAVLLQFPAAIRNDVKGSVLFMRPSDSSKDRLVEVWPDENGSQLVGGLTKGVFKMRIEVSSGGRDYFQEAVIHIR